jgi:hypothetical protein
MRLYSIPDGVNPKEACALSRVLDSMQLKMWNDVIRQPVVAITPLLSL